MEVATLQRDQMRWRWNATNLERVLPGVLLKNILEPLEAVFSKMAFSLEEFEEWK